MDIPILRPIGIIRTGHAHSEGTPLQPVYAGDTPGTVVVDPEYAEGLKDLTGFSRVWLLFWCHRTRPAELTVIPYRDTLSHGLFATRAPARPNPIGLSAVKLVSVERNIVQVAGADMLDGSPLLDIKPYVPEYDSFAGELSGWMGESKIAASTHRADRRFERPSGE